MKSIYDYLMQMAEIAKTRDSRAVERRFEELAINLAGVEQTRRIGSISLGEYEASLRAGLVESIKCAESAKAPAVYFEYDLDNDWQSHFFVCQSYNREADGDDDWACDWSTVIGGPECRSLSLIYHENGWDGTDTAKGSSLYLIARTVAAFLRAFESMGRAPDVCVCLGYHDQDRVFRIQERT